MGYSSAFTNQKTTLKKACKSGNCLASEFDSIWYNTSKISSISSKVIHFYTAFETLKEARKISDHIPLVFEFTLH